MINTQSYNHTTHKIPDKCPDGGENPVILALAGVFSLCKVRNKSLWLDKIYLSRKSLPREPLSHLIKS